jgi:hypothetical protein
VQLNSTDEEVISFWLSVSYLDKHHVPMFVAKQWGEKGERSQRVDGALGAEYRATGKKLMRQLVFILSADNPAVFFVEQSLLNCE